MAKSRINPKVDFFFDKEIQWHDEYEKLRMLVLDSGLKEELKWGVPCYTLDGKNVVLIHGFKHYCALLFVKGALMRDPDDILMQQTPNVQAGRHLRFDNLHAIVQMEHVIRRYVQEAIEVEKSGLKIVHKKTEEYPVPEELRRRWNEDAAFKRAFEALTPGRQRGYLFYFAQPKQSKTREARIEKYRSHILKGKGWNDD